MERKKALSIILLVISFLTGFILRGCNPAPVKEDINMKKLKQEKELLKLDIKAREEVIANLLLKMYEKDSLFAVEKQNRVEAQREALRQRKLRQQELSRMSDKEKEQLIIRRYEKDSISN